MSSFSASMRDDASEISVLRTPSLAFARWIESRRPEMRESTAFFRSQSDWPKATGTHSPITAAAAASTAMRRGIDTGL
jgi:hypothetical protein